MDETIKTNLKQALLNAVVDDRIIETRYEAIRYCYHYLRLSGFDFVPFWCFEYVNQLFWDDYLIN